MYRVRPTLEIFSSAINIPDWTYLFRSEQRLESTDWNISPWCVNFNILGPCIYIPLPPLSSDWSLHNHSTSANLLHLYILCAKDLSIAKGGGRGREEKKWSDSRLLLSLISSLFLCYLLRTNKIIRSWVGKEGQWGYLVHQGLYTVRSILSFVN